MQTFAMTVPAAMIDTATDRVLAFADGATAVPATGYWRPDAEAAAESEPVALLIVSADPWPLYRSALALALLLAEAEERAAYVLAPGAGAVVLALDPFRRDRHGPDAWTAGRDLARALAFPGRDRADDMLAAWRDVAGPGPAAEAEAALRAALADVDAETDRLAEAERMAAEAEQLLGSAGDMLAEASDVLAAYYADGPDGLTPEALATAAAETAEALATAHGWADDAADLAADAVTERAEAGDARLAADDRVRAALADLTAAAGRAYADAVLAEHGYHDREGWTE